MLTRQRLKEVLRYDPVSGIFTWLISAGGRTIGAIAGNLDHGYIRIAVDNERYYAHRLAWLYVYGYWPGVHIDHVSGDGSDNTFSNLRSATISQNQWNSRVQKNNSLGVKGVCKRPSGNYCARAAVHGKQYYIGTYPTIGEAKAARAAFVTKHHKEFAHG